MLDKNVKEAIRKHAIKNAIDYGKAREANIIGKILAEFPSTKKEMRELSAEIGREVSEINSMGEPELKKAYKKYEKEFEEAQKVKEEKTSKPSFVLDGAVKGKFVTRFAPEPSGYMHIGHSKAAFLAREFATIYEGEINLYFDDTNPEKAKQQYVDSIKGDLDWLGIRFDREYYSSDHIETLYNYAVQLIDQGDAYVCMCDGEKIKKLRFDGKGCEHRRQSTKENIELWEKMLADKFRDNQAVLRLKLDMKSLNTTMRDPVAFRIMHQRHYRQADRYVVWPTYDFNTPIVDSLEEVTDALRSKEYELRDELNYAILDMLKLRKPKIRSYSRLEILDNITSKRRLRELISKGDIAGWDDPRLVTIAALRRRGVVPEAIRSFVLRFGMSRVDSIVNIDMLLSENRKIVDRVAKRLFFVGEPVKMVVKDAKSRLVKIKLHPEMDIGYREYATGGEFYISGSDAKGLRKGEKVRLKDLFAVEITNPKGEIQCKCVENDDKMAKVVQWVDAKAHLKAKIEIPGRLLMGDEFNKNSLEEIEGLVEGYARELREGEIVQFERVGFFRLDNSKDLTFIGS